jgi:hypothetical protein
MAEQHLIFDHAKLGWMKDEDIRPYVFVRPENRIPQPGRLHHELDWFPHKVLYKNPLEMDQVKFADRILNLEAKAFGPTGMEMPRWVFYDCAIVPGFVAGFAARTASLPLQVLSALGIADDEASREKAIQEEEWTPLSLFIIIPTMSDKGEWVAHNLCSVNSILPRELQYYGIGFLSKGFGLWYANVQKVCGMTQWTSPSVRLHAHYGDFEVLTAFTPVHSYSHTLTYRVQVDASVWTEFFAKDGSVTFAKRYEKAGFDVEPKDEASLIAFQRRLEAGEGPFYIDRAETTSQPLGGALTIWRKT